MNPLKIIWQLVYRVYGLRHGVVAGPRLHLGLGTIVWAPQSLRIGSDCYIGRGCTIQVDGSIGSQVLIANRVGIVGRSDHDHKQLGTPIRSATWVGDAPERLSQVTVIGDDVWIGYGAIILSGVTVGRGAVVAAGAVVVSNVTPYDVVAGNPARTVAQRFGKADILRHEAESARTINGPRRNS